MISVAVILPSKGRPAYLRESLESLRQEGVEIHLYFCNNGGGITTREVVEDYKDKFHYVSYVEFPENNSEHIAYIQQLCAKETQCQYILEWTDDDRQHPLSLLVKAAILDLHPNAPFCTAPAVKIDACGQVMAKDADNDQIMICGAMRTSTITYQDMVMTCPIVMGATLWRRSAYVNACFPAPVRIGGEWFKYLEALRHADAVYCPLLMSDLRDHDDTDSNVYGFQQGEFIEMHLAAWTLAVKSHNYVLSHQQLSEMINVITNLHSLVDRSKEDVVHSCNAVLSLFRDAQNKE